MEHIMSIINQVVITRLFRIIDFTNNCFKEQYVGVEVHWSIIDGFLVWNHTYVMIKITVNNVIPILNAFETGVGYQISALPNIVDCRLTPDHIINPVISQLRKDI